MCVTCPACWRLEVASATTGRVLDVLHVAAFSVGEQLTDAATGSFTVATKDVNPLRLTPGAAIIYVRPLCGCDDRDAVAAVMVEKVTMGTVTTQIGGVSVEGYLRRRFAHMPNPGADSPPWVYDGRPQTEIAADIVNRTIAECGINLVGVDGGSERLRDLTVQAWDHANIFELLSGLAGLEDGIEWEMDYVRSDDGMWENRIIFRDRVGVDRNLILDAATVGADFTLDIDSSLLATRVRGVGTGSEADQLEAYASVENGFPCHDAVPAWKDEESQATLNARTEGYLIDFDQPLVRPTVTLADAFALCPLNLGDTITVTMCLGRTRYEARSRIVGVGWEQDVDNPPSRTLDLLPVGDAGISAVIVDTDADCPCGGDC